MGVAVTENSPAVGGDMVKHRHQLWILGKRAVHRAIRVDETGDDTKGGIDIEVCGGGPESHHISGVGVAWGDVLDPQQGSLIGSHAGIEDIMQQICDRNRAAYLSIVGKWDFTDSPEIGLADGVGISHACVRLVIDLRVHGAVAARG